MHTQYNVWDGLVNAAGIHVVIPARSVVVILCEIYMNIYIYSFLNRNQENESVRECAGGEVRVSVKNGNLNAH